MYKHDSKLNVLSDKCCFGKRSARWVMTDKKLYQLLFIFALTDRILKTEIVAWKSFLLWEFPLDDMMQIV